MKRRKEAIQSMLSRIHCDEFTGGIGPAATHGLVELGSQGVQPRIQQMRFQNSQYNVQHKLDNLKTNQCEGRSTTRTTPHTCALTKLLHSHSYTVPTFHVPVLNTCFQACHSWNLETKTAVHNAEWSTCVPRAASLGLKVCPALGS